MKVISIFNQKGGVGKTTIAVTLAQSLSEEGYRTLLIDADPQGNASSWIYRDKFNKTLLDAINTETLDNNVYELSPTLFLIPTKRGEVKLRQTSEIILQSKPMLLKRMCMAQKEALDYIIIDCSPSNGALERSVVLASNKIITPINSEGFSVDGLSSTLEYIEDIKEEFAHISEDGIIVVNNFNRSFSVHKKCIQDLDELNIKYHLLPQCSEIKKYQMKESQLPQNHHITKKIKNLII